MKVNVLHDIIEYYVRVNQDKEVNMALIRTVLVSTPELGIKAVEEVGTVWQDRPFKLQVGNVNVRLNYEELSKLMSDADGEIKDYLGDEHV